MAKKTLQAPFVVLVPLAVLAMLFVAYKVRPIQQPAPGSELHPPSPTLPGHDVPDSGAPYPGNNGGASENRVPQPGGEMDAENHFDMTVMVTTDDPSKAARAPNCSGILLKPQVVLTGAHCVCQSRTAPDDVKHMLVDASACATRAFATTVIYGRVLDEDWKEGTTESSFQAYEGAVRVHPDFELRTDLRGDQITSRADLALIVLDKPVEEPKSSIRLADREVRPGEKLIMSGYTQDDRRLSGGLYGIRYTRKHKALKTAASSGERIVYDRPDPSVALGFAGGPCIGTAGDGEEQWLVGIAAKDSKEELSCTSVYPYLGWLRSEIIKAEP